MGKHQRTDQCPEQVNHLQREVEGHLADLNYEVNKHCPMTTKLEATISMEQDDAMSEITHSEHNLDMENFNYDSQHHG